MTVTQQGQQEPFETRRWRDRTVRVFAAMDTMAQITERVLAIVGEGRRMNKISTYVHQDGLKDLSNLRHATGLHKGGHEGYPEGHSIWQRDDQAGFAVYLTHGFDSSLGTMESFGIGVLAYNAATEAQVRARHDNADPASVFDRKRDLTYLEIHGRPGQPHRDDRIDIKDWNEHGVLQHTIITFVEPDYCDYGRITETNYLILGHRKHVGTTVSRREEDPEVFVRLDGTHDDQALRELIAPEEVRKVQARPDVHIAWAVEETVTRERRALR